MQIRSILKTALITSVMLSLSACGSSVKHFSGSEPQMVAEPDNVSAMLADAADRVATSMEKLAAIEHKRTPGIETAPVDDAPIELRRAISVSWIGPVEPMLQALADRSSYNFFVLGVAPPVPAVVSIDAENKPVIEVLRNIGLQLGTRADVHVDGNKKTIEIRYAPVEQLQ